MKPLQKITKARAGMILDAPFFGSLALRLKIVEDPDAETAYTDGEVLGYSPEFIDSLSLEQTKGLLAHEVMHLACSHHTRRSSINPAKWNIAGDFAINDVLIDAGFRMPDGALIDPAYKKKSAEEIYALIPDNSGVKDAHSADPGGCGEVRDPPPAKGQKGRTASDAKKKQAEADWKVAFVQAVRLAKRTGTMPAGVQRLVDEILDPKVNWRDVLRNFIERSARNDYSWTPPNRRYIRLGLCLPSLTSKELGSIVVAVDTSGSIDNGQVKQFASEISSILEEYDTHIDVIYCDTTVQGHQTANRDDLPLKLKPAGGGGTDFRPAFEWVKDDPCCFVYLTDLECKYFPETPPDYPVLWVKTGGGGYTPPFGEVIEMG